MVAGTLPRMDEYQADAADIKVSARAIEVRQSLDDQRRAADESFHRRRQNTMTTILGASASGVVGVAALLYLYYKSGGVLAGVPATAVFVLSIISMVVAVLTVLAGFVALIQLQHARQLDLRRLEALNRQFRPRLRAGVIVERPNRGFN